MLPARQRQPANQCQRVILHIDLDQWEGLIAVNYPARTAGVTRHMRAPEARVKCPELQCVHVETIGGETFKSGDKEGEWEPSKEDRKHQKACLERYRQASLEIIGVLHKAVPSAVIEKASIDEVYIDVTNLGRRRTAGSAGGPEPPLSPGLDNFAWGSVVPEGPLQLDSEFERRLATGACIACRLRGAVRQELGFTCSAGIAHNKLLAKLGSAMHKPNQQTVVCWRAVPGLMQSLPLKKLRNFGGKLGAELEKLGCSTAGEVAGMPAATLAKHFGQERASSILYAVQGYSDELVQEKERPKSMLAAKSFEPIHEMAQVERWVGILCEELAVRMVADAVQYNRRPRSLHLHYRQSFDDVSVTPLLSSLHQQDVGGGNLYGDRSKSQPMPRFGREGPTAAALTEAVIGLFRKAGDAMPCTRLAVSASEFADGPLADDQGSIMRFFAPSAAAKREAEGQAEPPQTEAPAAPAQQHSRTVQQDNPQVKSQQRQSASKPLERLLQQAAKADSALPMKGVDSGSGRAPVQYPQPSREQLKQASDAQEASSAGSV
eukprot:jgi/Astpho2/6033/Aster-x1345